jgi:ABC-2 type transport system ATP-binding protein
VIIIDRGRIVATDTQEELERRLKGTESLYVEFRAPQEEVIEQVRRIPGVKTAVAAGKGGVTVGSELGRDLREELTALAAQRRWAILELRPVYMSLEEVFLRLTTHEDAAASASASAGEEGRQA